MKVLPKRYVDCAAPIPRVLQGSGDFVPSNESAILWLWEWPRLLGWKRSITWLFLRLTDSPGRSRCTLWGIDSAGRLIIVDPKSARGQTLKDPFRNLLAHAGAHDDSQAWATRDLRARWREYFATQHATHDERSTAYKRAVERAFALRQAAGNPPPVFVALVAGGRSEVRFSEQGVKNLLFLRELVGSSRVLLRAINGSVRSKGLRIQCWSPRSPAMRRLA